MTRRRLRGCFPTVIFSRSPPTWSSTSRWWRQCSLWTRGWTLTTSEPSWNRITATQSWGGPGPRRRMPASTLSSSDIASRLSVEISVCGPWIWRKKYDQHKFLTCFYVSFGLSISTKRNEKGVLGGSSTWRNCLDWGNYTKILMKAAQQVLMISLFTSFK